MKFLYILPSVAHSRFYKRIKSLEQLGIEPLVMAYERDDFYSGKSGSIDYYSLGKIKHKRYIQRLYKIIKSAKLVRQRLSNTEVVYAFGLDSLLLAWLATLRVDGPKKMVYEVGDILGIMIGDSYIARLFRWLERFLIRRTILVVVTSQAYIDGYFIDIQRLNETQFLEIQNKLNINLLPKSFRQKSIAHTIDQLTIGYFGVIRCNDSWDAIKKIAAEADGRIKVLIKGYPRGIRNFLSEVKVSPNIEYGGTYVAPDELPEMYQKISISWIAFNKEWTNKMWSRANRFYEACYFQKPMIAQAGTVDGREVEKLKLGKVIDLEDIDKAVKHILGVTDKDIITWKTNLTKLPENICLYENEHKQLLNLIL